MQEENTATVKEIQIIDEDSIRDKIHVIRGVKVMLDYDLARIYGYATKDFNRQVRNNSARFEGDDFMFQLSSEELDIILRCKKATSSWGGSRYRPNAFTEQGIYMLMTVLRGELAVKQSRALIRAFQTMKNNISMKKPKRMSISVTPSLSNQWTAIPLATAFCTAAAVSAVPSSNPVKSCKSIIVFFF